MLKRIFYISILTLLITACKNEPKIDGFAINATIDAAANGKKVTLYAADPQNQTVLDTARVANGQVTLKGKVTHPDLYLLTIEGQNERFPLMVENSLMELEINNDSLMGSTITGSTENKIFDTFKSNLNPIREKNKTLMAAYRTASQEKDTATMEALRTEFEDFVQEINNKNLEIAKANNNLVVSAMVLESLSNSNAVKIAEAKAIYDTFTETVKTSPIGTRLGERLNNELATAEGSIAPNFSAPNPEGEMVALNDIKGKVTIIDFWAAWCGPCRKENPNVVKVYNKYHEKGLEIIGVSLDGTPRQKDAKAAWTEAIEKDGLTWHQVSNLKYFNGPVAQQYNIRAIPATFILDAEGKIVAKNLRGKALEDKIAEMLD
ncbi:TlpA disulfide reductase family protein [Mangrovimonas yunxiaonensis]|uniref:TlpA disulfide reductase family protein n=1 Tax=Mangrovimonas yunxiaonensis TaxID=1197477 RepID=UPI000690AE62|nr:TlpA disulfide reductase family protein [Mangrovimonas yunxiaonensis]GGH43644.1 thiol:disulfide interchange protein [Mangrovimonas yunxiaonensis]